MPMKPPPTARSKRSRPYRILGFAIFGPEAGEVVAVVQTAMSAVMPYTGVRDAMIPDHGGRS